MNRKFEDLFSKNECSVLEGDSISSSVDNSELLSTPSINLVNVFSSGENVNCAVTLVTIRGETKEPDHYHLSNVIGLVIDGEGFLRHKTEAGETNITKVSPGLIVTIPKGAFHYFYASAGAQFSWIAFEFSSTEIDYQKHYVE